MTDFWVRETSGKAFGPYTKIEIQAMANSGLLRPEMEISVDHQNWRTAAGVKGLFRGFKPHEDDATREIDKKSSDMRESGSAKESVANSILSVSIRNDNNGAGEASVHSKKQGPWTALSASRWLLVSGAILIACLLVTSFRAREGELAQAKDALDDDIQFDPAQAEDAKPRLKELDVKLPTKFIESSVITPVGMNNFPLGQMSVKAFVEILSKKQLANGRYAELKGWSIADNIYTLHTVVNDKELDVHFVHLLSAQQGGGAYSGMYGTIDGQDVVGLDILKFVMF